MEDKKKFVQAAGLVVGEPRSPEQMWLRSLIEDLERQLEELEQAEIESEEGKTYTITAPSCLSKGGLLDIAKVLNALPPERKIRVALDLSEATSLTYIAAGAFVGCGVLENVKLPPSVREISQYAFSHCRHLYTVDIPSSVTTIGYHAFYNCERLKTVKVEAETPPALGGDSVFSTDSLTKIQVPSGSVAAYKAAEVWKDYAEKIKPITP